MKLSGNQKIVLGLAIGGGLAWLFLRNQSKAKMKSDSSNQDDMTHLAKTREEKIEYILDNLEANDTELKSGFSGERFEFDPTIGYAIPIGTVHETEAGNQMIISRDGNFANEIYFNADGEETDNPVEEAEAILNNLSDLELNVVYACVLAKKENPNIDISDVTKKIQFDSNFKKQLNEFLSKIMNDIKSIKKTQNWSNFFGRLRQRARERREQGRPRTLIGVVRNNRDKMRTAVSNCGRRPHPIFSRRQSRADWNNCARKAMSGNTSSAVDGRVGRQSRASFRNQVINRNV